MLGLVPLVFMVAGITAGVSLEPFQLLASFLPLVLLIWRRPVFVAVTQRQLICYRLSRNNNAPVRLLFCAPPSSTRVTYLGRLWPTWRSVRYDGPVAEGQGLRLMVGRRWRRDLDEVLGAC